MSSPEFDQQLVDLVLEEAGITVDDPTLKSGIVSSMAETLANTPGTLSYRMRQAEEFEAAWGAMDDEEE
ncbi:MAG: hypothetical protein ABSD10_01180 [Candidatus Saccharimonadales bacterium]|jgi:hypothetical protein